jgi:hypothetical protein
MNIDRFARTLRPRLFLTLALVVSSLAVLPTAASSANSPAEAATNPAEAATNPAEAVNSQAEAATNPAEAANVESDCGGRLHFGEFFACPSISGEERHVYTVVTRRDADQLFIQLQASGDFISAQLTGPDEVFCAVVPRMNVCEVGAAGRYRIVVELPFGGTANYSLAVESMRTPSECVPLPNSFFSFASPGYSDTLAAGATATCFRFNQPAGTVLHLADPAGAPDVQGQILDAQFQPLCPVRNATNCTLTTAGPYRLFLYETNGMEAPYTLKMPRISNSAGCPVLKLASFGDPGAAVGTGTITTDGQVTCHKLKPAVGGVVGVRVNPDQRASWAMYDNAGQRICDEFANLFGCALPAAGSYSLLLTGETAFGSPVTYSVAATALFRNGGCAAVTGTSWDVPTLLVHQTSPVQMNCQPFHGDAGDRIINYRAPDSFNVVKTWIVDSTGTGLCTAPVEQDGCVLPATGTYRVVTHLTDWTDGTEDATYRLQVRRLSNPVGCPEIAPGAYGAPPAGAPGGIRCRILDIPAQGSYVVKPVDEENFDQFGQIFDGDGIRLNVCGTLACTFAPGRYTMVLANQGVNSVVDNDFQYSVALLPFRPSGCPTVSDAVDPDVPHHGGFAAAGEFDCVQLPSPAGSRVIELLPGDATGAGRPFVVVVDADGQYVCDSSFALRGNPCELVGTAPFYASLNANDGFAAGSYTVTFARVDGPPACPVLPRTAEGATVTTGGDEFAVCFSIPADDHAALETYTFTRLTGAGSASMTVFDGSGIRRCATGRFSTRTFNCSLPAGPATVILETDAVDATYQVTRTAPA